MSVVGTGGLMGGGAFYARPEQERCQGRLPGCSGTRNVRINCTVEGADIMVCYSCAEAWRRNPQARDRCPRCVGWIPGTQKQMAVPDLTPPLSGPVADAVDHAMHQEGLTIDIREKVLRRLARDANWLADSGISDIAQYSRAIRTSPALNNGTGGGI